MSSNTYLRGYGALARSTACMWPATDMVFKILAVWKGGDSRWCRGVCVMSLGGYSDYYKTVVANGR
jgi:hypothetical protein